MKKSENVKFEYLYRDAGNYKNWGEVVFSNRNHLSIQDINKTITDHLIDKLYFNSADLKIKELNFLEPDIDLDHSWHEFYRCITTSDPVTDSDCRDISEIIKRLIG